MTESGATATSRDLSMMFCNSKRKHREKKTRKTHLEDINRDGICIQV